MTATRYLLRRVAQIVPVAVVIVVINFFLLRLAPGDMADVIAGQSGSASPEFLAQLRQQFGTDQPLAVQFAHYASRLAHLDLGYSFRYSQPVLHLILQRVPASAALMLSSLALALAIGCALGTVAALSKRRGIDILLSTVSMLGFATPLFWVGLMLIVVFSVKLGWLPSGGMHTLGVVQSGWTAFTDVVRHMLLPVFCLTLYYVAIYARLARSSVLEVNRLDFVRTARAKGASRTAVVFRHILPNALLSIVTMTALQFGALFSGSIAIETVFAWPGLGLLALDAVTTRDLNLLLGILFVSSLFVLIVNLLTDLLYARLDPRIEVQS